MSGRVVAFLLTGAVALTGCASARAGADGAPPVVVVLFDVSRSTRDVRGAYLDAFEDVVGYVADANGTLVADVIDENPLAHSTYPIDVTFPGCSALSDNPLTCEARTKTLVDGATAQARAILTAPLGAEGTDIHDGLRLAERVFDAYPDAGARSLVLLSDMLERSAALNVVTASRPARAAAALDALQAAGGVPSLTGVSVSVVGAGVRSGDELPADRILAVQAFWEAFFDRAGADLPPDRYGAALVRFP